MKNSALVAFVPIHAAVGVGGYAGLMTWAAGAADGALSAGGWFLAGAALVRYVLLQPLAYWLIETLQLAWWTWPGLAGLALICLGNSAIVAVLLRLIVGTKRAGSGPTRH